MRDKFRKNKSRKISEYLIWADYFRKKISDIFLGDEENFLGELTIPSSWWPSFTAKVKIFVIKGNEHEVRKGGNIKVELDSKT